MRKASAPALFLVGLLVLAAVAALTFGVASLAGLEDDDDDPRVATPTTPTPTSDPGLRADQVAVSGTATLVTMDGAVLDGVELALPAITTPSAGLGAGAQFEDVQIDGEPAAITWDAGRPLDLADDTPLRLRPRHANLSASPTGIVVGFPDGEAVPVAPGDYEIDAPVAVTTAGLGEARDSVRFTAADLTTVAFSGGATGTAPIQALAAEGPGRVLLQGTFEVRRADGSRVAATSVELPSGSFRVRFTPTADGVAFTLDEALLEGAVVVA